MNFTDLMKSWPHVADVCGRITWSEAEGEDAAAFAYAKAWEQRDTFRGESDPMTWVRAIAVNKAREKYRRREREMALLEDAVEPATDAREEDCARIRAALAQMNPPFVRALVLYHVLDWSMKKIAAREGVALGTAHSRLFAARRQLRDHFKRETKRRELCGR